jgi:hypothetical protein
MNRLNVRVGGRLGPKSPRLDELDPDGEGPACPQRTGTSAPLHVSRRAFTSTKMPAGSGGLSDGRALGRCRPSPGHEVRRAGHLGFQFPCPRRLIVTMAPVRFGAHHVTRRCVTEVTQPRPTSAPIPHQRALRPATTTSPPSGVMSAAGRSTRAVRSGRVTGHALADWGWHRAKPRRTIWTRRGIVMAQGRLESSGERPPSGPGAPRSYPSNPVAIRGLRQIEREPTRLGIWLLGQRFRQDLRIFPRTHLASRSGGRPGSPGGSPGRPPPRIWAPTADPRPSTVDGVAALDPPRSPGSPRARRKHPPCAPAGTRPSARRVTRTGSSCARQEHARTRPRFCIAELHRSVV